MVAADVCALRPCSSVVVVCVAVWLCAARAMRQHCLCWCAEAPWPGQAWPARITRAAPCHDMHTHSTLTFFLRSPTVPSTLAHLSTRTHAPGGRFSRQHIALVSSQAAGRSSSRGKRLLRLLFCPVPTLQLLAAACPPLVLVLGSCAPKAEKTLLQQLEAAAAVRDSPVSVRLRS